MQRRMSRTSGWWAKSSRWTAVRLLSLSSLALLCFVRQWLVRVVAGARKDFLKFVTARVRLPSGGLKALSRKVTSSPAACHASKLSFLSGCLGLRADRDPSLNGGRDLRAARPHLRSRPRPAGIRLTGKHPPNMTWQHV